MLDCWKRAHREPSAAANLPATRMACRKTANGGEHRNRVMESSMQSSATSDAFDTTQPGMVQVWDPLVRAFHWSLVAAFAVAFLSGDEALALHVWSGYAVGGLVLLRIAWGFIGPGH